MTRRIVRWILRAAMLACLAAAAADVRTAGTDGPRTRVYVLDVSASVRVRGTDAVTLEDARRLIEWDIQRSGPDDPTAVIHAGAKPVVAVGLQPHPASIPDPRADASGSNLDDALDSAIAAAESGDILLMSDGLGPFERAVAVAAARSIPVHTMATGPAAPRDVRIDAVDLPAGVAPGAAYSARIRLVSTAPMKGAIRTGDRKVPFVFEGSGAQDFTLDDLKWKTTVTLDVEDDCPDNNTTTFQPLERSDERRTLQLSALRLPLPGDLGWHDPSTYNVIVLNNFELSGPQMDAIAAAVRAGAGLVILGGSKSYALGGWAGTPIEEISPLWAFPDDRSAIIVALDCSGSMNDPVAGWPRMIDAAASAIASSLKLVRDDDELGGIAFSGDATPLGPLGKGSNRGTIAETLRRQVPGGSTRLEPAISRSLLMLAGATASKKRILLLSDGKTDEADEILKSAERRLREQQVGLCVVAIAGPTPKLQLLGGTIIPATDAAALAATVGDALSRSRELTLEAPAVEAGWPKAARINRVSAKPTALILARAGDAPLAASAPAGRGRVAAVTFGLEGGWAGEAARWTGLADLVSSVAPQGGLQWRASVHTDGDDAVITVSPAGTADLPDRIGILVDDRPVEAVRRGARRFEARLAVDAGTHVVRHEGRVIADFVHPTAAEFRRLGADRDALRRIAAATGGREIRRVEDLPPRRAAPSPESLRPPFLVAALALFFLDLVISTFWRPM